jgi:hypothetical protein
MGRGGEGGGGEGGDGSPCMTHKGCEVSVVKRPCHKNQPAPVKRGSGMSRFDFFSSKQHTFIHNLSRFQHGENSQNRRKIRLIETGGYKEMSSILADQ